MSFILVPQNEQKKFTYSIRVKIVLKNHYIEENTEVKLFDSFNDE